MYLTPFPFLHSGPLNSIHCCVYLGPGKSLVKLDAQVHFRNAENTRLGI